MHDYAVLIFDDCRYPALLKAAEGVLPRFTWHETIGDCTLNDCEICALRAEVERANAAPGSEA